MNIEIEGLTKIYNKEITALNDLSLTINPGMFGLLGPNGAGKTTLMRIIATLIRPTEGVVDVMGYRTDDKRDKWEIRNTLGYLPQELSLYNDLTAYEFLDFMGALKKLGEKQKRRKEIEMLLETTNLTRSAKQKIKTFSGGMKRRVGIAQALLGDPKVLIVDEPTAGLDPQERVRFRNLLVSLAADRLVILSTHIVEDVAHTCQQVSVLHQGNLLFKDAAIKLITQAQGKVWEVEAQSYQPGQEVVLVASMATSKGARSRILADERPDKSAKLVEPTMEDGYLWLMKTADEVLASDAQRYS